MCDGGWQLYDKTGSGYLLNNEMSAKLEIRHGWFVGVRHNIEQPITLGCHSVDGGKEEYHAGPRANTAG